MSQDKVRVCLTSDIPEGGRKIFDIDGVSIGIFHVKGRFYALLNRCPHLGAPLCKGRITGLLTAESEESITLEREGEVLRCPWHGWEFDITDGRSVFNPHRVRARSFPVSIEEARAAEIDQVETFPTGVSEDWVFVTMRRKRDRVIPTSVRSAS